jgi:hypothetical protein
MTMELFCGGIFFIWLGLYLWYRYNIKDIGGSK